MRAAVFLFSALLGCSRTTLELPNGSTSTEPAGCPSGGSWVVSAPVVIAPGTRTEVALGGFAVAAHGDVTAIAHDSPNDGGTMEVVRFLTGELLGPRQPLADHDGWSNLVGWTGDRFRVFWTNSQAHFFTRDFDRSGVALTDAIDHGRLAERIGSDVYLNQVWPDALLFSVGGDGAPRYVSLAPDGSPVGPRVVLETASVLPWQDTRALRGERLFVPINNIESDDSTVARLVTFNESTRSIESTRELARGPNLEATSIVAAPDGALLVTVTEYGQGTELLTVRDGAIERTTLPVGATHASWLVDNGSGTAALISYSGRPKDFASALHFSPMRLDDRSIGGTIPIVVNSKGLIDARVVAAGCGYAVVWSEFAVPRDESYTMKFARITRR